MTNPNDIDKEIGARIKALRQTRKMSQETLGKEAGGITFQQIQKYEKGTNRVSGSRLVHIARALDVDVALFFEGYRPDGVQSVTVAALLTENKLLKERLAEIRKLSTL